ncbi:MAG: DUF1080 domain-containing protein [Prolixibacteraceae bacterium]
MKMIERSICLFVTVFISAQSFAQVPVFKSYDSPLPKVVTPGTLSSDGGVTAPSDAISLFNGANLSEWACEKGYPEWNVHDGVVTVEEGAGDIFTKKDFGSFQLHIEWMHPADISGEGQMRGNSGIFLHGLYEIQILETFNNSNKTYVNGQAGAIYKQHPPLVNSLRRPGEWNAYDIIFTAPTFNPDGTYRTNPRVTVMLNGVMIQNNAIIYGTTFNDTITAKERGGITIQDHGCKVSYRNIWIRDFD